MQQVLPQAGEDWEELQSMVSAYLTRNKRPHLHLFSSPSYAEGVSLHTKDGRHFLVSRAAADSGCIPSIMSSAYAKSVGLSVTELTAEEQARVRSIDGTSASRIRGRTQPVSAKLAAGTAGEVELHEPKGFLVVNGAEAHEMYDLVLGRQLLDQVSGFVVPVLQRFYYFPSLTKLDLSFTHSLPVTTGRLGPAQSQLRDVAALAEALAYLPAGCAVLEPEPTYISSSSCSGGVTGVSLGKEQPAAAGPIYLSSLTELTPDTSTAATSSAQTEEAVEPTPLDMPRPAVNAWGVLSVLACVTWPLLFALWPIYHLAAATTVGKLVLRIVTCICWPAIWSCKQVGVAVGGAWAAFAEAVTGDRTWEEKRYKRRGKEHRAKDGGTIRLAYPEGYKGDRPKKVLVYSHPVTWRSASATLSARTVLLVFMLLAVFVSSAAAVHARQCITAPSEHTRWAMAEPLPLPLPYTTCHLLVAGLTEYVSDTFRGGGWSAATH